MKKTKAITLITFLLLLFITNFVATASNDSTSSTYFKVIGHDFEEVYKDYYNIFSSIPNADLSTLKTTVSLIAVTGISMLPETAVKNAVRQTNTQARQNFFASATNMGNVVYAAGFGGAIYLGGLFSENKEIRVTGRLIFESMLLAGAGTTILKSVLGRARPYAAINNTDYRFFTLNDDFMSFPSGHSTVAFSVASVLADRVDTWWGYLGFYSLAGLTGISRVYLNKHWLSDVVAGAAIGTISGLAVSNAERQRNSPSKGCSGLSVSSIKIIPTINGLMLYCEL